MPVDMNQFRTAETQLDYNEPPPLGVYDVRVDGASIFESKAGDTYLKMTYTIVSQQHAGHQWEQIHGFKDKQLAFTKMHIKRLGVDVGAVSNQDELEQELDQVVGRHYTVEVVARGPYTNTDIKASASAPLRRSDVPIPGMNGEVTPGAPATAAKDDDDCPF